MGMKPLAHLDGPSTTARFADNGERWVGFDQLHQQPPDSGVIVNNDHRPCVLEASHATILAPSPEQSDRSARL